MMTSPQQKDSNSRVWACLLHLSFNMWEEYISPHRPFRGYRPDLQLSEKLWNDTLDKMADEGLNMVVINLGDAIEYDSHPEIAVNNAWSITKLCNELDKIRKRGLEPIPNLNFSAGHNTWMGSYSRMVSTKEYYKVQNDLISEVIEIFDTPRFFHLGMDEEGTGHQSKQRHIVSRKNGLWWGDFYSLIGQVEKRGSRAWIWSDNMLWNHPKQFFKKMPKSVLQSNWYYGENFDLSKMDEDTKTYVKAYIKLEKQGYDQIPTGSFHSNNEDSILNTVKFGTKHISDAHLDGFLQTFWIPTIEGSDRHRDLGYSERILRGIELVGNAQKWFIDNKKVVLNYYFSKGKI